MPIEQTNTKYGNFYGYSNDHLFKCLKNSEYFDNAISDYIINNIQKTDICVDVGANISFFTVQLAKKCKKVYSFEPQKEVYDLLCSNIVLNNLDNVFTFNLGVYSKDANFDIAAQNKQDGWVGQLNNDYNELKSIGSIAIEPNINGSIKCVALDNIIKEKIDFIKIDAQGADIDVIIGAENLIKLYHPKIIFEYDENLSKNIYNRTMNDLKFFIKKFNYNMVNLGNGNYLLE